ncbi:ADP-dependent glucokinase [Eumeta japonica]|uniref:ADP-dependent glucokinase n=1 Tax=Eumeta variegata TaxID=151549 RepID=A0A4C1WFV5_EUMVA|nr:ADP-dependent glucokinase [Eumeta japonica]
MYYRNKDLDDRLSPVRDNLLNLETQNIVAYGNKQPRVALGYGACHDLFVKATALLNHTEMNGDPRHFNDISTKDELLRSFAYYFKHGAAAERFMSNGELYDNLVEEALNLPGSRWALGGNAPLMAKRFYLEGWKVLLGGKMSKKLKSYIPEDIKIVGDDGSQDIRDDVHMILEYKADEKWGPYKAPRANRYILHNDDNNPLITSLETFGEHLPNFKPHLVVISGLQMMDNYPFMKGNIQGVREERIMLVREQIYSQPSSSLVHFEMASYVELELLQHLTDYVIPNVDSIGMNEQELENLYHVLEYGNVSVVADSNPRVATSLDHMRKIFSLIRNKNEQNKNFRKLTRIHVHTLAYQAILTVTSSQWKRTKAAAAKASLTAHRYVCDTDDISVDKSKLLLDDSFSTTTKSDTNRIFFEPSEPVSCWREVLNDEVVDICVAPVLICTEAQLTAGAGDNISAAGLVLQVQS